MKEAQKLALVTSLFESSVQTCPAQVHSLLQSPRLQALRPPLKSAELVFCVLVSRKRPKIVHPFKVIGELFKYMEIINECIQMEIR